MCDHYSCIFYPIPTKSPLKTLLKPLNTIFLKLILFKQNGISVKLSNIITYCLCNVFAKQKCQCNDQSWLQSIPCVVACESHDLNMDFRSFDNYFKQLWVTIFLQECRLNIVLLDLAVVHCSVSGQNIAVSS